MESDEEAFLECVICHGAKGRERRSQGSLNCKHDYCNEHEVLQVADVLVSSGLRDLGWKYVNLDDCWGAMARTASGALSLGAPWMRSTPRPATNVAGSTRR